MDVRFCCFVDVVSLCLLSLTTKRHHSSSPLSLNTCWKELNVEECAKGRRAQQQYQQDLLEFVWPVENPRYRANGSVIVVGVDSGSLCADPLTHSCCFS